MLPNRVAVDYNIALTDEYQWCVEAFGVEATGTHGVRQWYSNAGWTNISFNFIKPMHATMFRLRWL
jgi:hypothetical protein